MNRFEKAVVGVPKETKTAERRIALVPKDCEVLVQEGIRVLVESNAGLDAGFEDASYRSVGVELVGNATELYKQSDLIVKVKEPQTVDLEYLEKRHRLFCFLHLAAFPELVKKLQQIGLTAFAFETVQRNGQTPLLAPMSAIAGRLGVQIGTGLLHSPAGGKGVLLGGTSNHPAGNVMILGAGIAGSEAAFLASGMGARVRLLDIDEKKLKAVKDRDSKIETFLSTPKVIEEFMVDTDLLIGAVYLRGKSAPKLVDESLIQTMSKGSVVVDISIDQGGCIATAKPCTYQNPSYQKFGIIHSAISNLPAAVPKTASTALSQAIVGDVGRLAKNEIDAGLLKGKNIEGGRLLIEF